MKRIYLDNAATTPVDEEVVREMVPVFTENYGNPSSIYKEGRDAKKLVEENRAKVADALGAQPNEIFFTGSGTEADNWASRAPRGAIRNAAVISLPAQSSIMRSCTRLSGWKKKASM